MSLRQVRQVYSANVSQSPWKYLRIQNCTFLSPNETFSSIVAEKQNRKYQSSSKECRVRTSQFYTRPSFFRFIYFVTFRQMFTQYINNWGLDLHEMFYIVSALLMLAVLQMLGEFMYPQGNIWNSSVLC